MKYERVHKTIEFSTHLFLYTIACVCFFLRLCLTFTFRKPTKTLRKCLNRAVEFTHLFWLNCYYCFTTIATLTFLPNFKPTTRKTKQKYKNERIQTDSRVYFGTQIFQWQYTKWIFIEEFTKKHWTCHRLQMQSNINVMMDLAQIYLNMDPALDLRLVFFFA